MLQNIKKNSNFAEDYCIYHILYMALHVFNPEHDLAMASNHPMFTAPHAATSLRESLCYLSVFFAQQNDQVLVSDIEIAHRRCSQLIANLKRCSIDVQKHATFLTYRELRNIVIENVEPWGWNRRLRMDMILNGVSDRYLPTEERVLEIRDLSNRKTAAEVLTLLQTKDTVGDMRYCTELTEVEGTLCEWRQCVVKAPWSGSGRGVRFITIDEVTPSQWGWVRNVISRQGGIMVEPYYNKVKDFGMEFHCNASGSVSYDGLSLFDTRNGAYTGNLLATEDTKERIMSQWLPVSVLHDARDMLIYVLKQKLKDKYVGPLGVDMMVVAKEQGSGFYLHPCVEINFRQTMGQLALKMSPTDPEVIRVMRIVHELNRYKLRICSI